MPRAHAIILRTKQFLVSVIAYDSLPGTNAPTEILLGSGCIKAAKRPRTWKWSNRQPRDLDAAMPCFEGGRRARWSTKS
jgi:hypothetical protein